MRDTQLILVEGIPGSGKSTNSRFLSIQMERNGRPVTWYHEIAKKHPTCYLQEATLPLDVFEELTRGREEAAATALDMISERVGQHVVVDLLDLEQHRSALGEELAMALKAYDDWDLTPEQYCAAALDKWKLFVENVLASGETVMLDCSLFQFQMYGLLLHDWSSEDTQDFVRQVIEIILPLRPVMVYLYQEDLDKSFARVSAGRGEKWVQHIVDRDARYPFHTARQELSGVERYKLFLKTFRRYSDELFAELPFPKVAIENLAGDWQTYEQEMLRFLEIPYVVDPNVPSEAMASYAGTYRSEFWPHDVKVWEEDGKLWMETPKVGRRKMIPKTERSFYLHDNPIELHFADNGHDMRIGGTWMYEFCAPGTPFAKA
ncbi:MAG: hypothetical protein ACXVDE_06690 [Tumebacillaceae bacterium]